MTFRDFVKVYEKDITPKLKEKTWLSKEHVIQTKLLPYFESKKMCDVTPRDIIQWQHEMLKGKTTKGLEYATTYLKSLQAQLSFIFNHAVRLYELSSNLVQKAGPLGRLYHNAEKKIVCFNFNSNAYFKLFFYCFSSWCSRSLEQNNDKNNNYENEWLWL